MIHPGNRSPLLTSILPSIAKLTFSLRFLPCWWLLTEVFSESLREGFEKFSINMKNELQIYLELY